MKIKTRELKEKLLKLSKFMDSKNSISILSHVNFFDDHIIALTSKNSIDIKCNGIKENGYCYHLESMIKILSSIKSEFVIIDNEKMIIDNKEIDLFCQPSEKFPVSLIKLSLSKKESNSITVNKKELQLLINSASIIDDRRFVNGIMFNFQGKNLDLVGTDGKQITIINKIADKELKFKSIIPLEILNTIQKVENEAKIFVNESDYNIESKDLNISGKNLNHNYPPYKNVIPDNTKNYYSIDFLRSELLKELEICKKMSEKDRIRTEVKITDKLNLNFEFFPGKSIKSNINCNKNFNDEFKFCFNLNFMNNFLKLIDQESINIKMQDSESIVISEFDNIKYLMMPIS